MVIYLYSIMSSETLSEKQQELLTLQAEFQDYQEMSKTIEIELEGEISDLKSIVQNLTELNRELKKKNSELKVR
jgi:tRNA(Ser,Leu) C12 N-acetylase TAN1